MTHGSIRHLFVQGLVRSGQVEINIPTEANPADIATKTPDQATVLKHLSVCGVDVSKRTADNKEASQLRNRATVPAWSPAAAGLQACLQGLAAWAATLPTCKVGMESQAASKSRCQFLTRGHRRPSNRRALTLLKSRHRPLSGNLVQAGCSPYRALHKTHVAGARIALQTSTSLP